MDNREINRRTVLRGAGVVAGGAVLGQVVEPAFALGQGADRDGQVNLTEGTNVRAAVSPDARSIAFDLVTAIWTMPISGGPATRLTDEDTDATQPCWSPGGDRLAFQAYRDGYYHIWTVRADGSGLTRLTEGPFDHREPAWSPDGSTIAFASDRAGTGSYGVFTVDLASGQVAAVTDTAQEEAMPAWSPDGRRIAYTVDDTAIAVLDVHSGERFTVVQAPDGSTLFGPSWSPDGAALAHVRVTGASTELIVGEAVVSENEDVFAFPVCWLSSEEVLYTADGRIKRRVLGSAAAAVPFTATLALPTRWQRPPVRERDVDVPRQAVGIASPVASRDGTQITFRALGALWVLTVGNPEPRRIVDDGYFNSDPDFMPDGRSLVYSSDRAGDADLWVRDLVSGADRRMSGLPGAQTTPRVSPAGTEVAYVDHDGAVWVLDVGAGESRQVTPTLFMPGRPSWSADGRTLALAAVKPYSTRFREGTSQILTVDLDSGAVTYTPPWPQASIATRGDDGPVWSPDGRHLAFVVESCAWVVPVDADGRFTADPRRVTTEVTDSLSWLGTERLLYLNNGRLRSVALDGGEPADIPLRLRWQPARSTEYAVVRAGALWDGRSQAMRSDVDVVIDSGRIAAVLPAGGREPTVDARHLTLMPGLIEAHNHWHLRGRQWGARQGRAWLSYGITTTRSPGDPAYQMVETREALAAGTLVGPRFFGTGEAVDGARVYYNFMRPTRSEEQLALELERAERLGYDLIKTYVRLPVAVQRRVVREAHRIGIPLTSHYLYPAAAIGMDGMEHTGATNRLGYSHTTSRIGRAYADVVEMFVRSGMSVTPTLFTSAAMYAEDRSLVEDPRTRALFPAWEYERLVRKADAAQQPDGDRLRDKLVSNVDMLLRIHRGGGVVIAGTDAPLDDVAVSLHTNLRAMVRYGFTPFEALTTATRNTARWLGMGGRLGEITAGAEADLSFVRGDPLTDIRDAAAVEMVMVRGRLWTVPDLLAAYTPTQSGTAMAAPALAQRPATPRQDDRWWHAPEWSQRVCCGA